MDPTLVQSLTDEIESLKTSVTNGTADMIENTAVTLIEQLAADVANPQQTYNNLASGLGPLAEEIASDALTPVFDFVDWVSTNSPTFAQSMIGYDDYITLKIPMLADLCKLFGIGSVSGSELKLSAHEAIFFPLALIAWVAVYQQEGKSISSVDALEGTLATAPGVVGAVDQTLWNYVRLAVDGVLTFLFAFSWDAQNAMDDTGSPSQIQQVFAAAGVWFNAIRWINDFIYTCWFFNPNTGQPWDYVNTVARLGTAIADIIFTLPGKNLNSGSGWPSDPRYTDIDQFVNFLLVFVSMGEDTLLAATEGPDDNQIMYISGQDYQRSQGIAAFLYNYFSLKAYQEPFSAYILTTPAGFLFQIAALFASASATAPGGSRNNHRRRRIPRPHRRRPRYRQRRFGRYR
jgi:hypothetical protein